MGSNGPEVNRYIRHNLPDVVGLQEVVAPRGRTKVNLAASIAEELGLFAYFSEAIELEHKGERIIQGNAILSKYPFRYTTAHLLNQQTEYTGTAETQPRVAVEAIVNPGMGDLDLFCTHLAYSPKFAESAVRKGQIQELLRLIPDTKAVLMGDFNSNPDNPEIGLIRARMINTDPKGTDPTWTVHPVFIEGLTERELRFRLDHIFVSPDIKVLGFHRGRSEASDHLPIHATIEAFPEK